MSPHNRRVVKTVCAALFVLLLAGVTYQGVATALERRAFHYPGRLVPVGDHQLHIHCTGRGTPTVVLEAPAFGFSASWSLVQSALSGTTRVCSYDRAGLGWSEGREGAFAPESVAVELQTLLAGAGERPPYVLVGDELGAAFARLFAARYPHDTVALVEADVLHAEGQPPASPSPWLARTGLLRLARTVSGRSAQQPGPRGTAVDSFSLRPDHLTRGAIELRALAAATAQAAQADVKADLVVRGLEKQGDALALSTPGTAAALTSTVRAVVLDVRRAR